jgi:hypothetical protein
VGEINKTVTLSASATVNLVVKWILADTEPAAPSGYVRFPDFDINLGDIGTLWAFKVA